MKVWFHRGSTDFFTVFVLLLLLSLQDETVEETEPKATERR